MADKLPPITAQLDADISGLSKGLAEADKKMAATEEKGSGHFSGLGKSAALGLAGAGAAAVAFGASSLGAFEDVAKSTASMQRITGESAETMSRLRFAGEETGVSAETLSKNFVKLAKDVGTNNKALGEAGIATKDAQGNALSMNDVLMNTAEAFKNMPDGIGKTTLATKLFGKSGTEMLPFLNKGKDGLAELEKESDKFGLTIGQSNVDAMKKNTMAHRQLHAAFEGLKVQIGAKLMPIVANISVWFASHLPAAMAFVKKAIAALTPAFDLMGKIVAKAALIIQKIILWLADHKPVLIAFGVVIAVGLVAAFTAWAIAAAAAAAAQLAALAPIAAVVAAIVALGVGIYELVTHWHTVVAAIEGFIQKLADVGAKLWAWITDSIPGLNAVWDGIKGIFQGVFDAIVGIFDFFRDLFTGQWGKLWGDVLAIVSGVWDAISAYITYVIGVVETVLQVAWDAIKLAATLVWDGLKAAATLTWDLIKSAITTPINALTAILQSIWDGIKTAASAVWDGIKTAADATWGAIKDAVMAPINALTALIGTVWDGIKTAAEAAWSLLKGTAIRLWNDIQDAVMVPVNALIGLVKGVWDTIKTDAGDVWSAIKDAVSVPIEAIKAFIQGLIDKVQGIIDKVASAKQALANLNPFASSPTLSGNFAPTFKVPGSALGSQITESGILTVGEKGAELVRLPAGAAVYPHGSVPSDMAGGGGTTNTVVHIHMAPGADGNEIIRTIKKWEQRNGPGWRAA